MWKITLECKMRNTCFYFFSFFVSFEDYIELKNMVFLFLYTFISNVKRKKAGLSWRVRIFNPSSNRM